VRVSLTCLGQGWCGRRTMVSRYALDRERSGLKEARTRSRLEISSEIPSRRRYSACIGHKQCIGGAQNVEGEQVERRGTVENHQVVRFLNRLKARGVGGERGLLPRPRFHIRAVRFFDPGSIQRCRSRWEGSPGPQGLSPPARHNRMAVVVSPRSPDRMRHLA